MALTVRVVGVGDVDGGGLVNPEDPEVIPLDIVVISCVDRKSQL